MQKFFPPDAAKPQPSVTAVTWVTSRVFILRNITHSRDYVLPPPFSFAEKSKIPDSLAHYRGQLLQKRGKSSNFAA